MTVAVCGAPNGGGPVLARELSRRAGLTLVTDVTAHARSLTIDSGRPIAAQISAVRAHVDAQLRSHALTAR